MDQRNEQKSHEYTQKRVIHACQEFRESRIILNRLHGAAHYRSTYKYETETRNYLTDRSIFFLVSEKKDRSDLAELKRNELGSNIRTDIGTHYYPECLSKIKKARINKSDDHDRRCRRGLHKSRDDHTYQKSEKSV